MAQSQFRLGVFFDHDQHIHILHFLTGQGYVSAGNPDAGIMLHSQIQQVQGIAVGGDIDFRFPVEAGQRQVFGKNFLTYGLMNGTHRYLRRTAGIEALDQIDAVVDHGPEFLGGFDSFGQSLDSVLMCEVDGVAHKKLLIPVVLNIGDQFLVDLDDLRRITEHIHDVAVAGAVIINGDLGAASGFAEAFEAEQFFVAGGILFRQLKNEAIEIVFKLFPDGGAVFLVQEVAGDCIDEDLAAEEAAVIQDKALHDPENSGFFHVVQTVVFPGDRQYFQRGQVD